MRAYKHANERQCVYCYRQEGTKYMNERKTCINMVEMKEKNYISLGTIK